MVLRVAVGAKTDMALFELLRPRNHLWTDARRLTAERCGICAKSLERGLDELPHFRMIEIAGRRDDHVRSDVGAAEVFEQRLAGKTFDGFFRSEDWPPERMAFPEMLGEQLVDKVVWRVLDHLDFFEDDLFFALDLVGGECRTHHDVGQQVDGKRQMLVENLDVVARVLLRGKGIELTTDRVN